MTHCMQCERMLNSIKTSSEIQIDIFHYEVVTHNFT